MGNPFPTQKTWQDAKKNHGIPDGLLPKGSVGKHWDDLHKRYASGNLDKLTSVTAKSAKLVSQDAKHLISLVEKGALAKKAKFKNFTAAKKIWDDISKAIEALDERVDVALNPLKGAKDYFAKGAQKVKASIAAPTDSAKLEVAYREGVRNDIGQRMRAALKHSTEDPKAYPGSVVTLLKQYDAIVEKWGSRIDDGEAKDILASDADRTKCFADMKQAVKIAEQVLKVAG